MTSQIEEKYDTILPPVIKALKETTNAAYLEINARRLWAATLAPWTDMCSHRSARFRPGWTNSLDRKAKLRKKLLESPSLADRTCDQELDRDIKRRFRQNCRRPQEEIADQMEGGDPTMENTLLKGALALKTRKTWYPPALTQTRLQNSCAPSTRPERNPCCGTKIQRPRHCPRVTRPNYQETKTGKFPRT